MCAASCLKIYQPEYCNGFGCCQIGLIENWRSINISVQSPSGECAFSTILEPTTFEIQVPDKGRLGVGTYGLKVDWGIKADTCSSATQMGNLTCSRNAHCLDVTGMPGYKVCRCDEGYKGDGYQEGVPCTDINECDISQKSKCIPPPVGSCVNMNGSYTCFCLKGKGDGKTSCTSDSILAPLLIGISTSLVGGPLIGGAMFWVVKKRKQLLLRRKYFLQNKGLLLQEYISSDRGRRKATIFSESELVKATNNFSEDLKVGVGGFGNVYQGKLAEGRLVAIKKCKDVDEEQINQFINEVIILTQIDHRNIVKLLGCCLETRIPLLVYEYVSNGTLSDHLHGKDGTKFLTWDRRLQIITETAEAVAYLHSSASVPIVHRDIKSANILLDSTYTVKLSDFGLSRLMPIGNTHLTTGVKGTLGYVDPQYYKTVELTSKTDVYSFGVVMVELLTSMKAMSVDRAKEERILADLFLCRKGQGLVAELFDTRLVEKDQMKSMKSVANLAEACLNEDVNMRPSMKEILQELLLIRSGNMTGIRGVVHSWVSQKDFKVMNEEERSVPLDYKRKPLKFNVQSKRFHSAPVIDMAATVYGIDNFIRA
ncbi:putative wall-associated receptor kinase-like 16 [Cryptomeria japonica]|uniref:putative wall-associated receptor kinase-like 16 n=1 Tax=Cryptomeria japonica TaxID=3369 RepID=UPI0027DA2EED|nr:putative wall-associated receptor kinase-like 16 [Cryptomeria japonica]